MDKKHAISNIALVAFEEIKQHNGLPKDENESEACKTFLELLCQYTNSYSNKNETKNVLKSILNEKNTKLNNKTLNEELLKYITKKRNILEFKIFKHINSLFISL